MKRLCLTALAIVALAGLSRQAAAQARFLPRYQEPEWLTFHLSEVSAGVYAEGTYEYDEFKNSSIKVSHENLFVGPSLGFNADGSVYHPNLLRYFISTEGAFGWNQDRVVSFGTASTTRELEYLGHLSASIDLLGDKPYHGNAYVNYDHTYRDNDFFNRVTVDSLRYGARAAWHTGLFTFNADYLHTDEESTSPYLENEATATTTYVNGTPVVTLTTNQVRLNEKTVSLQDAVTFTARHERDAGSSAFNYNLSEYSRKDGSTVSEGTDHSLSLADSERFGPRERNKFNANASLYLRDNTEESSDQITAFANLNLEHNDYLSSSYELDYDHYDTGNFRSDSYTAAATLSHQLYESLASSLVVRGSDFENSDDTDKGYTRRFGAGLAESYTKRIAEDHRLHLKNSVFIEHTEQENIGTIKAERHSFLENTPEPNSFILNQQNVTISTIVVTDPNQIHQYVSGLDYEIIPFGNQTEIHRVSGSAIPDIVVVDYQSEPTPAGGYNSVTEAAEVRLELWKNLLALYGRANLSLNDAPTNLMVQEVTSYIGGVETSWKALHGGAEYEIYDSTESHYRATRLFQSVSWHPSVSSSLSLDATESWINYVDSNRQQDDYRLITRYHDMVTPHLSLGVDAGVAFRRGDGVDQLLAAFRPEIKYVIGKTTIDAGYDYEYDLYLKNQQSQTHRFTLRYKRVF
jgi:hypothetical protein